MAYMTHGEAFAEMWDLSRSWGRYQADCQALAAYCMEAAAAGLPCEMNGARDFALVKFVCAMQDDKYAPLMARVFACYVQHGLINPNAPINTSETSRYRSLNGEVALVQAVLKGNMHAMELLVQHGASTNYRVSDNVGGFLGEDFFEFVRLHYGETHFSRPSVSERATAAARLIQVAMERCLQEQSAADPTSSAAPAPASAPRRRVRI